MTSQANFSRIDKNKKRRNNNRSILFFIFLAVLFLIILLTLIFSGNRNDTTADQQVEENVSDDTISEEEVNDSTDPQRDSTEPINEHDTTNEQDVDDLFQNVVTQQIIPEDDNVVEAYVGNWPPIGTTQQEPHTTDYSDGSQDRTEIKRAVSLVTDIPESELIELWIGNGGDQKVIATVTDQTQTNYFRIYLSWVENEGWQVTKIERIKEFIR